MVIWVIHQINFIVWVKIKILIDKVLDKIKIFFIKINKIIKILCKE